MTQPTAATGLTSADAARALIEFGANELEAEPDVSAFKLFLRQFTWVDLRNGISDAALDRLEWGITGVKPKR